MIGKQQGGVGVEQVVCDVVKIFIDYVVDGGKVDYCCGCYCLVGFIKIQCIGDIQCKIYCDVVV